MEDLPGLLRTFWGLEEVELTPLAGGMNSRTWLVGHGPSTYVVKHVPASQVAELVSGCEVASTLASAGLVTGQPVPTLEGRLAVDELGLALLHHVPGRELTGGTDEEQRWMGATLAGVHAAGGPAPGPGTSTFMGDWLSPRLPGVAMHSWLLHAIETVRDETDSLEVTWSVVHTDPAPEAFVHDERTGVTGLIDWAGATRGPVLYDVASAVMYLGGSDEATAFLAAYRRHGPLGETEMRLVDAFRRFRWAVQGAYFARRIAKEDLAGVSDRDENEVGLDRARRGLEELGPQSR